MRQGERGRDERDTIVWDGRRLGGCGRASHWRHLEAPRGPGSLKVVACALSLCMAAVSSLCPGAVVGRWWAGDVPMRCPWCLRCPVPAAGSVIWPLPEIDNPPLAHPLISCPQTITPLSLLTPWIPYVGGTRTPTPCSYSLCLGIPSKFPPSPMSTSLLPPSSLPFPSSTTLLLVVLAVVVGRVSVQSLFALSQSFFYRELISLHSHFSKPVHFSSLFASEEKPQDRKTQQTYELHQTFNQAYQIQATI